MYERFRVYTELKIEKNQITSSVYLASIFVMCFNKYKNRTYCLIFLSQKVENISQNLLLSKVIIYLIYVLVTNKKIHFTTYFCISNSVNTILYRRKKNCRFRKWNTESAIWNFFFLLQKQASNYRRNITNLNSTKSMLNQMILIFFICIFEYSSV